MIDTITLLLEQHQFTIKDPNIFTPRPLLVDDKTNHLMGNSRFTKCVFNPSKKEQVYSYKPYLTLFKRKQKGGYAIGLKIQFSAPKLLFGNNFQEIEQRHFEDLIHTLYIRLSDLGVEVKLNDLTHAEISAIHFCKNIILDDGTRAGRILEELSKANLNAWLDTNKADYRNGGHVIKWHAKSYEITFYDKKKDLQQSKKSESRALEKDNAIQYCLLGERNSISKYDVIRFELRVNTRAKLRNYLKQINYKANHLTLYQLFRVELSKQLLLHVWQSIKRSLVLQKLEANSLTDLYEILRKQNQEMKYQKLLELTACLNVIADNGLGYLRSMLGISPSQWYRLKRELNIVLEALRTGWRSQYSIFQSVDKTLVSFKPI